MSVLMNSDYYNKMNSCIYVQTKYFSVTSYKNIGLLNVILI